MANRNFFNNLSRQTNKLDKRQGINPYDMDDKKNIGSDTEDLGQLFGINENQQKDNSGGGEILGGLEEPEQELKEHHGGLDDDEEFMPTFEQAMNMRRGGKPKQPEVHEESKSLFETKIPDLTGLDAVEDKEENAPQELNFEPEQQTNDDDLIKKYENEIELLQETVNSQNETLSALSKKYEESKSNENNLEEERKRLEKELQDANDTIKKLQEASMNDDKSETSGITQEQWDEKVKECEELKVNLEKAEADYKEVAKKNRSLAIKNTNAEKSLEREQKKVEDLEAQLKELGEKVTQEPKKPEVEENSVEKAPEQNGVALEVLAYVCNQTITHMSETYKSDIYTDAFAKKLFAKYVNGETNGDDPLFHQLMEESLEKGERDPYLEDLTEKVLNYIKGGKDK